MPPLLCDLPNESLSAVFAHLNPPSLAALVRVSRRLHNVGQRLLYTDVTITDHFEANLEQFFIPRRLLNCCASLIRRPYLAQCIRRLIVRWTRRVLEAHKRHRDDLFLLAPDVLPALQVLLRNANQIEVLELHLAGLPPVFDYNALLAGASFRLRRLALSGSVDAPVEAFLRTQPSIVYLHLPEHRRSLVLTPTDLPLLETFRGDLHCAASIIPGRPISSLVLSGHEPSGQHLVSLGFSARPIRRLDLSALSITPTQLLTISKHLTTLETLRMRLALRHTLHFSFNGMMLLSALTQVLGAFQNLRHLDLSPTSVDGIVGVHNEIEEHALCAAWSAVVPSLRRVKFPSGTDWIWTSIVSDATASGAGDGIQHGTDAIWRPMAISPPISPSP